MSRGFYLFLVAKFVVTVLLKKTAVKRHIQANQKVNFVQALDQNMNLI